MALKDNNNPNIGQVNTRQTAEDAYLKEQRDKQKAMEEEIAKYKRLLQHESLTIDSKEQAALVKKLADYKRKQYEQEQKDEAKRALKDAQNLDKTIAKDRKKRLEEERKEREEDLQAYRDQLDQMVADGTMSATKAWAKTSAAMIKDQFSSESRAKRMNENFNKAMSAADGLYKQVAETFSKYQTAINTRLQGSGSGFSSIQNSLLRNVGITPYLKTQTLLENLNSLVESGIAFNLEQRAFLQTVSDKVATTFDAANASLMRIVRLQQADSTASRLGMEAYLTRFLNGMFQNTEYLSDSFDDVTTAIVDATSQLDVQRGVEFEYQIQKWLGSLSSVGLSSTTVGNLASALGYLATGDVSGLESSSVQSLIVMAASRAGLSYADMLTRQINTDETNKLLKSIVEYLQEIGSSTNQVVKNQYASTFGVSVSDLTAALNLNRKAIDEIYKSNMTYGNTIGELEYQMRQVTSRTAMADAINTVIENAQFSMFSNIADNPVTSALWRITDMIQEYTGGINIPAIFGMGTGLDLNTTVENLMKLGIMGVGSLGMIGDIISGVGNTVDFSRTLSTLGINRDIATATLGEVKPVQSGMQTSKSTVMGQSSGSAFYESSLASAKQSANEQMESESKSKGEIMASSDVDMKTEIADKINSIDITLNKILDRLGETLTVRMEEPFYTTGGTPGLT